MSYEPETMTYDALLGGTVASGVIFLVSLIPVVVCDHTCHTYLLHSGLKGSVN